VTFPGVHPTCDKDENDDSGKNLSNNKKAYTMANCGKNNIGI